MTKDEALKMAIEGYQKAREYRELKHYEVEALYACKEALEPEPMTTTDVITCKMVGKCCMTGEALEQPTVAELNNEYLRDTYFEGLNQPAQEPYRCHWVEKGKGHCERNKRLGLPDSYTHPHQWQGLTDFELKDIRTLCDYSQYESAGEWAYRVQLATEQALKNKNGKM